MQQLPPTTGREIDSCGLAPQAFIEDKISDTMVGEYAALRDGKFHFKGLLQKGTTCYPLDENHCWRV